MTKQHRDEKNENFGFNQSQKDKRIHSAIIERLGHIRRKLSRGASNIYRMIRTRGGWGNKQLWGSKENKHHHKPK